MQLLECTHSILTITHDCGKLLFWAELWLNLFFFNIQNFLQKTIFLKWLFFTSYITELQLYCNSLLCKVSTSFHIYGLFANACSDRAMDNSIKVKEDKFKLDIRKKFFTRVVRHQNRLPREPADAPSWGMLVARLEGALGNMI